MTIAPIKGLLDLQPWPTRHTARQTVIECIGWYNGSRLHSTIGYRSPPNSRTQNE